MTATRQITTDQQASASTPGEIVGPDVTVGSVRSLRLAGASAQARPVRGEL
jgi:hypothetical protein